MHILEIKLAGQIKAGGMLPEVFATVSRVPGAEHIKVVIMTCDGEREHFVQADCAEDVVSMAECLAHQLGGAVGEYMKALNMLIKHSRNL